MEAQTMCWRCNAVYLCNLPSCPECEAANANHDPEKAQEELEAVIAGARSC